MANELGLLFAPSVRKRGAYFDFAVWQFIKEFIENMLT